MAPLRPPRLGPAFYVARFHNRMGAKTLGRPASGVCRARFAACARRPPGRVVAKHSGSWKAPRAPNVSQYWHPCNS